MAEEDLTDHDERILNRAAEVFFLMLLVVGVLLYVGYSMRWGAWLDIGIYAVTVPFMLFGVAGLALNHLRRKEEGRGATD